MISHSSITLSQSFQLIPAVSRDFPQIPGFSRYFPLAKECGSVPQWSRKYKLPIRVTTKKRQTEYPRRGQSCIFFESVLAKKVRTDPNARRH